MNIEEIAEGLIKAVGGIVSEKNIEGVITVFKGIKKGVDNDWEAYLTEQTNEVIMRDSLACPSCNTTVLIERQRNNVSVENV